MGISSNSLFHYTDSIDILVKILSEGFKGSYCKEVFSYNNQSVNVYVPKISFCDIPLTTFTNYSTYGKFGIGLSKEWGIKKKLNPVLYLEKNSYLVSNLVEAIKGSLILSAREENLYAELNNKLELYKNLEQRTVDLDLVTSEYFDSEIASLKQLSSAIWHSLYTVCYVKHYENDLYRNDKIIPNYRFYDEREWCFTGDIDWALQRLHTNDEVFIEWRGTSEKKLIEGFTLDFSYSDIKYIIVESQDHVERMVDYLENIDLSKISTIGKKLLFTKIIVYDDLKKDF